MTVGRFDARFLLAERIRTARLGPRAEAWRDELELSHVEVVADGEPADLAVATTGAGARAIVVEGGRLPRREARGREATTYVVLPGLDSPVLYVPLGQRGVARYAVDNWTFPRTMRRRVLNRLGAALMDRRVRPPTTEVVTVADREQGPPYLLGAARDAGLIRPDRWLLLSGSGDALGRGVFFVFAPGDVSPSWAVKFARRPGYDDPFTRDERALGALHDRAPTASARAPRVLGRVSDEGVEIAVETAAVGSRVSGTLRLASPSAAGHPIVEAIASWIVDLGVETATASAPPEPVDERAALARSAGLEAAAIGLDRAPFVLTHDDLGSWNVIGSGSSFTVVDWESSRPFGEPLWDLWYFLADAYAQVDCATERERDAHFVELFTGRAPSSPRLAAWTTRALDSLGIDVSLAGPLATLCWLHHSRSRARREGALQRHRGGSPSRPPRAHGYYDIWTTTPGLGPGWRPHF